MVDRISEIQKPAHVPDVEKWANTVRLMRECDGRTLDEIRQLFDWANQDDFWRANIRSPDKLRKQWDTLTIQRTRHKANGRKQTVCTTGFYHDPARSKDSSHGKWD
jgi:hypothetical protein